MTVGEMWCDSGCVRGVGAEAEHVRWAEYLKQHLNLKPVRDVCYEHFQFGDGNTVVSRDKCYYPTFLEGKY